MLLSFGNGGWVEVSDDPALPNGRVYVRYRRIGGGVKITEVYVDGGDRGVDMRTLGAVSVARLEALIAAEPASSREELPAANLSLLAAHYATTFGRKAQHWVADAFRAQVPGGPNSPSMPAAPKGTETPPARLLTPEGPRRISDDFLQQVAAAYRYAVSQGLPPLRELEEQSGAPYDTVKTWVSRARKAGYLPSAGPGKARA